MPEFYGGQEGAMFGFPLQEQAIARHVEKMIAEGGEIEFDENGVWNDSESGLCVAKRREDGTFHKPDFYLAAPIELKTEDAEYRIYQVGS